MGIDPKQIQTADKLMDNVDIEIDASLNSHSPIEFLLSPIYTEKPNYSEIISELQIPIFKAEDDPRLQKFSKIAQARQDAPSTQNQLNKNAEKASIAWRVNKVIDFSTNNPDGQIEETIKCKNVEIDYKSNSTCEPKTIHQNFVPWQVNNNDVLYDTFDNPIRGKEGMNYAISLANNVNNPTHIRPLHLNKEPFASKTFFKPGHATHHTSLATLQTPFIPTPIPIIRMQQHNNVYVQPNRFQNITHRMPWNGGNTFHDRQEYRNQARMALNIPQTNTFVNTLPPSDLNHLARQQTILSEFRRVQQNCNSPFFY